MIKISALWRNKTKDGREFFKGKLGDAQIVIFENGYKKEEKHPDYIVYIDEIQKKDAPAKSDPADEDAPF